MGQWVVTVAGIAILSVLCDVILPEGQTRKYVKTVFGVVVTLVIVQPLIGLFGEDSWFSFSNGGMEEIQQQYIESVDARHNKNAEDSVKLLLEYKGVSVSMISVSDLEKRATIQLDETYSRQAEDTVLVVVSSYFPDYEIITIWK
ncbi:MAG: stage III sporulation protein AF [Clostridiales bacterium]|nr:stage III sporulation protein AF [Clostridiales bacterium]